jgi:hypothetical protein
MGVGFSLTAPFYWLKRRYADKPTVRPAARLAISNLFHQPEYVSILNVFALCSLVGYSIQV